MNYEPTRPKQSYTAWRVEPFRSSPNRSNVIATARWVPPLPVIKFLRLTDYVLFRSTAVLVNQLTQEILFIFGVSSSVLNPYVYGLYSMGIWKNLAILRAVPCLKGKFRGISRETRFSCGDNSRGLTDTESDDKSKRINHSPRNQSSFTRLTPFHSQSRWACNDVLSNSFSQNKSAVDFWSHGQCDIECVIDLELGGFIAYWSDLFFANAPSLWSHFYVCV